VGYGCAGWPTKGWLLSSPLRTDGHSLRPLLPPPNPSNWNLFAYSVTNWFNNQGLMYAVSNAFGQVRAIAFDIDDRATNSIDANGVEVDSTYDDLGRVLTRTYPDSGVERFGYSARGLTAYTNQLGLTNFYAYDAARRKTSETNANGEITRFAYSPASDLLTLTDGKNQVTTWTYDQYGRTTNKVDVLNNLMFIYGYDANSRLTNRWTPAKGATAYRYDVVGNLTNIVYPIGPAITLQYDVLNRLSTMVDAVGTTAYGYDAAGQLLSENGPWADDTVSYTYNNRLRASVSVLAPNVSPWVQSYGYDAAKRLTSVASPAGAFSYDYSTEQGVSPASLVRALTLPNGAYITNSYDNVARLLSTVLQASDQSTINSHSYQLNIASQRTQQVFTGGNYVDYTYDKIGQLQSARGKESGGNSNRLHEQLGYTYDAAGNLNWRTNNALIEAFNVNSLNELTTATNAGTLTVAGTTTSQATNVTVNGLAASLYGDYTFASTNQSLANGNNTFTAIAKDTYGRRDTNTINSYLPSTSNFTYDQNGNLTGDGKRCFAYDDEKQLTSVWVTNVWRSDFAYDGKMRRRMRYESTWSGTTWVTNTIVRYVYDGNLVIQERDANNLPLVAYTRGKDPSGSLEGAGGIGGLLARTDHSTLNSQLSTAFYHCDGNGNITCLINTNQIIVAKYLYDPYGNILSQSGSFSDANLYRFSSKEFHIASGLVYYLYRFYEPSLQRWLNRDPKEERGFDGRRSRRNPSTESAVGAFDFARNDAVNSYDLLGLDIDDCLTGCDQARKNAGIKRVTKIVEETWYIHGVLVLATGACMLTKSTVGTFIVGAADVLDITIIVKAGKDAQKQADKNWKTCCTNCGTTWHDPEKAKLHIEGKD
jgi:RHS repeat-associated protein